ncbi:MAG: hypothetical protein AB7V36_14430 [Bacteroidales bacterium]
MVVVTKLLFNHNQYILEKLIQQGLRRLSRRSQGKPGNYLSPANTTKSPDDSSGVSPLAEPARAVKVFQEIPAQSAKLCLNL